MNEAQHGGPAAEGGAGERLTAQQIRHVIQPILDVLCSPAGPDTVAPELLEVAEYKELYQNARIVRELSIILAKGELSADFKAKGYVAAHLKSLQANLRHLTWQTKRISQGDLTQRVDFMGDFSEAFNAMVLALEAARRELETLASTDSLTKLANRRVVLEKGQLELARCRRYGGNLAVLALDLDRFKKVNDTFGHHGGDRLLQTVAEAFFSLVRANDVVGRIGGEEFTIILPEIDLAGAIAVAERILDRCRELQVPLEDGRVIGCTISIGLAQYQPGDTDFEQLLRRADEALYRAKHQGRDRLCRATTAGEEEEEAVAKV